MAELDSLAATPNHKLAEGQKPQKPATGLLSSSRAAILILVAALSFFPSQLAPEFVNQTLLTRGWELLHLLLVGIAVSYGLFSQRNAEAPGPEKEPALRGAADGRTPQSYLTQLLQVSPVFDDEEPTEESCRLEMWTSRCHRGEPTVLVAPGSPGCGRRLLLPVRRLRSPAVPLADSPGTRKVRTAGAGEYPAAREEYLAGDGAAVDLASTIPWRSRSARMELKGEEMAAPDGIAPRSLSFRSPPSRPSSAALSPRRLSPAPSVSPESRAKSDEDPWKQRKVPFNASPPPPPPPPPPFFHKTPNTPPNAGKIPCRSFRDELTASNVGSQGGDDEDNQGWSSDNLGSPRSPRPSYYSMGRSVRTVRRREVPRYSVADEASPVTATREKEEGGRKKKTTTEAEDKAAGTASDGRVDSDETGGCPSDAGHPPATAATADDGAGAEENEVDKKADEFIAKFREQIRLQRIDSIKKTAAPGIPRKP